MTITYIYHSGFAIETDDCVIILDYYKDPECIVPQMLESGKRIYVMASHFHPDHFNEEVLGWKKQYPEITYVLSKDILRHRRAPKDAAVWIAKGGTFSDNHIRVQAFGSTDSGVSFLIDIAGKRIFHAGDLNNWHWQDESTPEEAAKAEAMYLGELKDICKVTTSVDITMFPVDARMGSDYMRGAKQFVERIRTGLFIPMHFTANGFESANAFAPVAEAHGCKFEKYEGEIWKYEG